MTLDCELKAEMLCVLPKVEWSIRNRFQGMQENDLQDAFSSGKVRLLQQVEQFAERGSFGGFVYRTYRNGILNWLLKNTREQKKQICYDNFDDVSSFEVSSLENQITVLEAIDKLPDTMAAIVRLKFLGRNQLTNKQIAEMLGISMRSVVMKKSEALSRLKEILSK